MTSLTEDEARQKWCAFARTAWAMDASNNDAPICTANRGNTDNDCHCIASDCMQWEEAEQREERKVYQDVDGRFPEGYKRVDPTKGCASLNGGLWVYEHTDVDERGRFDLIHRATGKKVGDCGLKRKPD